MVDLRKILATPKLMPTLQQVFRLFGSPLHILDPQGRVLLALGDPGASTQPQRLPIHNQTDTLGWVVGNPDVATATVSLLNHLATQERSQSQLSQRLLERSQELSLIYRLVEKVGSTLDLTSIARIVLQEAQPIIPSTNGSIMLLNQDSGYLEIIAAYGPEYELKTPMRLGEGIAGHVLISGQPEIINDVFSDMRLMIGNNLLHSLLCVPLKVRERVLGVINISHKDPITYSEVHLKSLITLAAYAAPTLNNALLHSAILQENTLHSEKRYRTVVEQSVEAILVVDCQTHSILEANSTLSKLLGYSSQDLTTLSLAQIIDLPAVDIQRQLAQTHAQQVNDWGSQRFRHQDGSLIDVEISVNLIRQGSRRAYCLIAHDLSKQKQAEAELHRHAYYDTLTTLPNRTYLISQLRKALEDKANQLGLAILFLDLDGFKVINDSLGYSVGDELLKIIAQRLCQCLSPQDTVARFGGDEFVILLESIRDADTATQTAQQVMQSLQNPIYLNDRPVFPTVSIGIALGQRGEDEAENLLQAADIAMHRAKIQGKSRYTIFDKHMYQQAMERMQLESDLRLALERDELRVFFQPIVQLNNERTVGFEALVRWQHPLYGLVPPDQFLPVAEEAGLIVAIDHWVLKQSFQQLKQWQAHFGNHLPVISVNLSGQNFSQPDLVEIIHHTLSDQGLSLEFIKFEITESILTEKDSTVAETLLQFKNMGLRLSIDDFGTGYSSLSRLHLFPIDTLKVDRSFVNRLGSASDSKQTVQMIITLAHSLEMDVVAEGIENLDQHQQLLGFHCEYGQGYHFSPPLPSEAATERLMREARSARISSLNRILS
ncbi:MAG: hypothetical protein OHK0012_06710 [Synechococcales cyanobacterium]